MAWVRSEYAGELAVLSAWLAALLPWNVTYAASIEGLPGSVLFIRFPFVQIRYLFGVPFADATRVTTPIGARELSDPNWANRLFDFSSVTAGYDVWMVGAVVILVAVLLSFAMYLREAEVEARLPAPSVRVMGGILGVSGLLLTVSTIQFYMEEPFGGIPIPIGLAVLLPLAGLLLTVDLEEKPDTTDHRDDGGPDDA